MNWTTTRNKYSYGDKISLLKFKISWRWLFFNYKNQKWLFHSKIWKSSKAFIAFDNELNGYNIMFYIFNWEEESSKATNGDGPYCNNVIEDWNLSRDPAVIASHILISTKYSCFFSRTAIHISCFLISPSQNCLSRHHSIEGLSKIDFYKLCIRFILFDFTHEIMLNFLLLLFRSSTQLF